MLGRNASSDTSALGLVNGKPILNNTKLIGMNNKKNLLNLMMSLRSGVCGGVRVRLGRLTSMINTANIQSLDFLVGSNKEDWHHILKGGNCPVESLATRMPQSDDLFIDDTVEGAPLTPRKRAMMRVSQVNLDHHCNGDSTSPLTSIFYTEEPDNFHDDSPQFVVSSIRSRMFVDTAIEESEIRTSKERLKVDTLETAPSCTGSGTPKRGYLSLQLKDVSCIDAAIAFLQKTSNLYDQIDLLHYLSSCKPMDFYIDGLNTLHLCLEEVYVKAMYTSQWTIVRQAAGLLKKVVNSLAINVTDLLIRQKPITVGFGSKETFITSPMSPVQLSDLIYASSGCDVREAPLVLEVLTYLGSFVRSSPEMFDGIIRIRIHFFIIAMREEISRMRGCDEEEAVEFLMQVINFD